MMSLNLINFFENFLGEEMTKIENRVTKINKLLHFCVCRHFSRNMLYNFMFVWNYFLPNLVRIKYRFYNVQSSIHSKSTIPAFI